MKTKIQNGIFFTLTFLLVASQHVIAADTTWLPAYTADLKNDKTAQNDFWTTSGDATISDGKLILGPSKRGATEAILFTPGFPKSARAQIDATPIASNPKNFFIDIELNDNVPVGTNAKHVYLFRLGAKANTCCELIKDQTPIESTANNIVHLEIGKTVHIIAEQNAGQLTLTVDGSQVFTYKDDSPPKTPAEDMVGIYGRNCTINVEKFSVSTPGQPGDVVGKMTIPPGQPITVIGSAQCARSCSADPNQVDHDLVIYAVDGSPNVKAEYDAVIDKYYPDKGLDVDQARAIMDQFDQRLKYWIVPGPLANKFQQDVEYPAHPLKITGTFFELDGKKWIAPTTIEETTLTFPPKMLAPDKPFVDAGKDTITLKVTDTINLKCIKIPAGKFMRGSPLYEYPRWQDEFPHEVTLTKSYYLAEIPVTQAMFQALTGKNPSKQTPTGQMNQRYRHKVPDDGPDYAVESAAYADIQTFCQKLSDLNGRKVRLPTEAEWEYAARVGTSSPCFTEKYLDQRSFVADTQGRCEPVKRHAPNAWGLYDMVKSGWELVSDYKLDNIREDAIDPQGPSRAQAADHGTGPLRRSKGGAYYEDYHLNLHGACDELGDNEEGLMIFRVVAEDTPAPK